MADDFSPITRGDTGAPFNPQFLHKDQSKVDLTGATITMKMRDANDHDTVHVAAGVWTIDSDPTTGKASYAYDSSDVAVAGAWELFITITRGGKPIHADFRVLDIEDAP